MARETDQLTVVERIVERIVDACPMFRRDQVYIVAEENEPPPEPSQGNIVCTVSPTDGRFDPGMIDGGGIHQVFEETGVAIAIWRRNWSDRDGHAKVMLTGGGEALLEAKKQILNALAGHDLLDAEGEPILADYMAPLTSSAPRQGRDMRNRPLADVVVTFATAFVWRLPGAQ